MTSFGNRSISASAGTGKTYRLAHRYLGLLAAGVEPDRICALTFSRKAAGEIFDAIVAHLCDAAARPEKRAQTASTIRREGLPAPSDSPAAYLALLRRLLDSGHRLRIGTLDSFILGVARAFPLELGIPPEARPMDGDGGEAAAARAALLARLFDPRRQAGGGTGAALLADVRRAQFGHETKRLGALLDGLVASHYSFYRSHRSAAWRWGDPDALWARDARWWEPAPGEPEPPADLAERLAEAFGDAGQARNFGAALAKVAAAAAAHAPDRPWPELGVTLLPRLLQAAADPAPPTLTYSRKAYALPAELWRPLRGALRNLVGVEVARSLERTSGLRTLLERYDALYAESQRADGAYTFEDLSRLLGEEGLAPSRQPGRPDRLYIDFRLDGRLDHWLLDEFQDTSDLQWGALANLVDEVLQDHSGTRSFFYVGDVKQSIYGWRGGNYRLFGQVLDAYRAHGACAIAEESISACHRSLPAVIEAVNRVFDGLSAWSPSLGAEKGPRSGASAAFARAWQRHESARAGEGEGFAALLEYDPSGGPAEAPDAAGGEDEANENPAQFEAVARILREVQPARRGLTAAVLVRSNRAGRACVDVLRRLEPGLPCVHEGKGGIADNPVVTLLLDLVRYAAHPGDTAAWRHLQMSPLADGGLDAAALPALVLRQLHARGFAETLRAWGARLGSLDAFSSQRLRELLAAAEQFDARGACDPDAFADHVEAYQTRSSAAAGAVRVMTVHQSKGLGFDLVIVPFDPQARSFERPGDPQLLAGADWVLDPPCGPALDAAAGEPLAAREAARTDANFGQLCVLYVALTRARQALVLLAPKKGESSACVREADLLRERLASGGPAAAGPGGLDCLYAAGDAAWYERPAAAAAARAGCETAVLRVAFEPEIERREPSKESTDGRELPARWLFNAEAGDVRAFGSAIHRLFQKIEWYCSDGADRAVAEWRTETAEDPALMDDVERQFRASLARDEVRRHLTRPQEAVAAEVWREAPFELLIEAGGHRHLLGGRFDRLVVERDAAGRPVRASVTDFKSNRITSEEELRAAAAGYAGQLGDYALAASRLLGLPPERVEAALVFTRAGRVWR